MLKQALFTARTFIEQKHYDEARTTLKTIDHPIARQRLKKIERATAAPRKLTPIKWQVTHEVTVSAGVMERLQLSDEDIRFLASIQKRVIETEVDAAPDRLVAIRPESYLTAALDLNGDVYAVSALADIIPDAGTTYWKTILCLGDELAQARAALDAQGTAGVTVD